MRLRRVDQSMHDASDPSRDATSWRMTVVPGSAPMISPTRSATRYISGFQVSQATTPWVAQRS